MQACTFMKMLEHGTMQEPTLEYQDYQINDIGLDKAKVDLIFKATNPNFYQIDAFYASYNFLVQDEAVASGKDILVHLIPEGESTIVVPVEVKYEKLVSTAGAIVEKILKQEKEIKGMVKLHVEGEYLVAEFFGKRFTRRYFYDVDIDVDVPLPEISKETIGNSVKSGIDRFFGTSIFGNDNTNGAPSLKEESPPIADDALPVEPSLKSKKQDLNERELLDDF